ncbi:hypothetical protein PPL_11960 [Heterostelium album PN500]|uniref:AAA+ ATPase domain-containing protein n=1 Tax=Heterostelium pallidum (strain ATCC 26659 / Pp 5 / PN500) TaxID=670386 RepID=D3BUY8_HETP5|nr:hypothetical protein PPL_11960 [Heterostelium album PN500]EFA74926.1 hypothetical protein PPL_11960 [Heterostelium album PN500]|eukprot:XP_020427060.1 hypothetical protein PPL_11960 [Heterostelium album PN500]
MDWNNNNVNQYFDIQCNSFLGIHYFQRNQQQLDKLISHRDSISFNDESATIINGINAEIVSILMRQLDHLRCSLATCDMKDSYSPSTQPTTSRQSIPISSIVNTEQIQISRDSIRNSVNRKAVKSLLRRYNSLLDDELLRQQNVAMNEMKLAYKDRPFLHSIDDAFKLFNTNQVSQTINEINRLYNDRQIPMPTPPSIQTQTPTSIPTSTSSTSAIATTQQTYQQQQFNNNNNDDDNNNRYQVKQQQQQQQSIPTFRAPIAKPSFSNVNKAPASLPPKTIDLDDEMDTTPLENSFKSAKDQFITDQEKKNKLNNQRAAPNPIKSNVGKVAGGKRKGFISPYKQDEEEEEQVVEQPKKVVKGKPTTATGGGNGSGGGSAATSKNDETNPSGIDNVNGIPLDDERLRNVEPRMLELICNEILDKKLSVSWDDIAGLEGVKKQIKELATYPLLRPDIFKGLRNPPKGLLLFGPPGTGKTMIGRAIASGVNATFFSISASSLTSKWIGDGEKMVRALFAVARCYLPSVIFIDEIDSLLTQRTDGENEASRRIKTEFLVQWDGVATNSADRMLLVGATNRPEELDEAARRRLVKRLYIPLPEKIARYQLVKQLLSNEDKDMSEDDYDQVAELTEGYSGSDMKALCTEAAMIPIRGEIDILNATTDAIRPIALCDFKAALSSMKPSVAQSELKNYLEWNKQFGGATS